MIFETARKSAWSDRPGDGTKRSIVTTPREEGSNNDLTGRR